METMKRLLYKCLLLYLASNNMLYQLEYNWSVGCAATKIGYLRLSCITLQRPDSTASISARRIDAETHPETEVTLP